MAFASFLKGDASSPTRITLPVDPVVKQITRCPERILIPLIILILFITVVVPPLVQPVCGFGSGVEECLVGHRIGESEVNVCIEIWESPLQLVVAQSCHVVENQ